jgi:hypothetical protein
MKLNRWLSVILMVGLILVLSSLTAQADPYRPFHHPRGHAYGWEKHHGFDRHDKHFRRFGKGPHRYHYVERVYGGPPTVAYVAPVAPVVGIPYAQSQPYYSQPAPRGLSGQLQYNF